MKSHHSRVSSKIGMLPGAAVYVGSEAPKPTEISAYTYNQSKISPLKGVNAKNIQAAQKENYHVWIDICGLKNANKIL